MKGYRRLKKTARLAFLSDINSLLTNRKISRISEDDYFRKFLFGIENPELSVRQYLLSSDTLKQNKLILRSIGSFTPASISTPKDWREILIENQLSVNQKVSSFLFGSRVILHFGYAFYLFLKLLFRDIKGFLAVSNSRKNSYIYFDSLAKGNLPGSEDSKENIVSWYLDYFKNSIRFDTILHSVRGINLTSYRGVNLDYTETPIARYSTSMETIQFVIWFSKAFFLSLSFLLLGRWWYAFFLFETVKMAHVHYSKKNSLAKQYLFHNSNWIYRPLWTFEAEKKGSEVIFYFYSTNSENFKEGNDYPQLNYGWEAMCWSKYLVWDEHQRDFLIRAGVNDKLIQVVGSIDFHSSDAKILDIPKGFKISVFDVQPVRDSYYFILGARLEYYRPDFCIQFLDDILNVSGSNIVLHKRKREIGKRAHPKYRKYIEGAKKYQNYYSIESENSARSLIQNSDIVISMPFTSTAIIAREEGKPSVYYDPSGIVQKEDRAAHGIPILIKKVELKDWLTKIVNSTKETHDT